MFYADLKRFRGEAPVLPDQAAVDTILSSLQGKSFVVSKVETKERRDRPRPPFITSTLQQAASTRLGFSARKTMQIAQRLYEGVDIGEEGPTGLITYMRTDSVREVILRWPGARADRFASSAKNMMPAKGAFTKPKQQGPGRARSRASHQRSAQPRFRCPLSG